MTQFPSGGFRVNIIVKRNGIDPVISDKAHVVKSLSRTLTLSGDLIADPRRIDEKYGSRLSL